MYLTQSLNPQLAALHQRDRQRATAQARRAADAPSVELQTASKEPLMRTVTIVARYARYLLTSFATMAFGYSMN